MNVTAQPKRRFIAALYDLVGDHSKRMTPFVQIAQQAQLSDAEAHGAFAALKGEGFVKSNRDGCVALTDTGRRSVHTRAR